VQEYAFGLARIELMGEVTAGRVIVGPEGANPILGVTPWNRSASCSTRPRAR
jgi:hypothetical protein